LFITATDTGIGKTFVACGLAKFLLEKGVDVAYYKPLSCGGDLSEDMDSISRSAKCPVYGTYHFKSPLSPYAASKIQKESVKIQKILNDFKNIQKKHDFVIVEGIGGALVPITDKFFVADLIAMMKIPAIVVARAGLGTINHTLLTIEALKKRKVNILGIILNGFKGKDISEKSNAEIIEELSGLPILEKIKWQEKYHKYDLTAKRILNV